MKNRCQVSMLMTAIFVICTGMCYSQVMRQEGDEWVETKLVIINTEAKTVSFKLHSIIEPDIAKWPSYTIKGQGKKIFDMEKHRECYFILEGLKKILYRGKTYRLYFDLKKGRWDIL